MTIQVFNDKIEIFNHRIIRNFIEIRIDFDKLNI